MATLPSQPHLMNLTTTSKLLSRSSFSPTLKSCFCTRPTNNNIKNTVRPSNGGVRVKVSASELEELKENWLGSLSCPFQSPTVSIREDEDVTAKLVIGIDPDVSGALALLKDDHTAQVFDAPHLQVLVGKRVRKRLDARSIVQLLHSFNAPLGTRAYIEQSAPYPQDGKQGWYSGGFTYGLWLGILVSSGFSVVPVSSRVWKDQFQLYRNSSSKDDSRKAAVELFPSLSSSLKRKKDHGRAEALLIAAYGKGLRLQPNLSTSDEISTPALPVEYSCAQ